MKKGVTLRVQLYIEGEDDPAHDFTQTGQSVITDVLRQGFKAYSGPYSIKVQKMEPVEGGDDDADSDADPTEIKPLMAYTPSSAQISAASATPAASTAASPASQPAAPQSQPPEEHKHHFWER
jgi:hypothetical protein